MNFFWTVCTCGFDFRGEDRNIAPGHIGCRTMHNSLTTAWRCAQSFRRRSHRSDDDDRSHLHIWLRDGDGLALVGMDDVKRVADAESAR